MSDEIDEETAGVLRTVMANSDIGTRTIYRELRNAGYTIDRDLIAEHRKGKCVCGH